MSIVMAVCLLAAGPPMNQSVGFTADFEKSSVTIGGDGRRTETRQLFRLYRSAKGWTRLEGTTGVVGKEVRFAFLTDPSTGRAVVLDLTTGQSLAQLPSRPLEGSSAGSRELTPNGVGASSPPTNAGENQITENLGEKTVEGLAAHGWRTTTPSSTVEVWAARAFDQPPLLVTTKESMAEKVERLFNVHVGEPDARLFEPLIVPP